jgi:hypothetical protein
MVWEIMVGVGWDEERLGGSFRDCGGLLGQASSVHSIFFGFCYRVCVIFLGKFEEGGGM